MKNRKNISTNKNKNKNKNKNRNEHRNNNINGSNSNYNNDCNYNCNCDDYGKNSSNNKNQNKNKNKDNINYNKKPASFFNGLHGLCDTLFQKTSVAEGLKSPWRSCGLELLHMLDDIRADQKGNHEGRQTWETNQEQALMRW